MQRGIRSTKRFTAPLSGCLLLWVLAGCGDSGSSVGSLQDASISGKVTYKGAPVTNALISFENPDISTSGGPIQDGTYSIPKLASGDFIVTVNPITPSVSMTMPADGKIPKPPERKDVPESYRNAKTSKAKATIETGTNTFDLDMVD